MYAMQPFTYKGNQVRIIYLNGNPWWVAKDVCDVLGLSNPTMAVAGLDEDEKGLRKVDTLGGDQELLSINEPGLYSLILRSHKPEAKEFKRWVTHEVLPAIHRTGSYTLPGDQAERIKREKLKTLHLGRKLLSHWGGLDERTILHLNDRVRDIVLDKAMDEQRKEVPISDRARELLGYEPTRSVLIKIGTQAAALYRRKYNQEPVKREQYVDGTTRKVNCYGPDDLDIMDEAIRAVAGQ